MAVWYIWAYGWAGLVDRDGVRDCLDWEVEGVASSMEQLARSDPHGFQEVLDRFCEELIDRLAGHVARQVSD